MTAGKEQSIIAMDVLSTLHTVRSHAGFEQPVQTSRKQIQQTEFAKCLLIDWLQLLQMIHAWKGFRKSNTWHNFCEAVCLQLKNKGLVLTH